MTIARDIQRKKLDPLGLVFCLVTVLILVSCNELHAAESNNRLFDRFEIVTGNAVGRPTVLSGFFLGGATAQVAVLDVGEEGQWRIRIYGLNACANTWVIVLEALLRPEVLFVDVARVGGIDRLITYDGNSISWFDPNLATERSLVKVTTQYNGAYNGELPRLTVAQDVNRDGRHDLLLPDVDGFWISLQMSDGSFTNALKLGPPEPFVNEVALGETGLIESQSYGEVGINAFTAPLYLNRVHQVDHNQDGLIDLVFWNRTHFDVHYQNEHGTFSRRPATFASTISFDADGVYPHSFEFSNSRVFPLLLGLKRKSKQKFLLSLRKIDGDEVPDLITLTLEGRSPLRQRSIYEVHFGTHTSDGIVFSPVVGTAVHPRGKAGGLQPWGYASRTFQDFDGDGEVDLMLRDIDIGLGGMVRAITAKSIGVDLEFFRMDGGVYLDKPSFIHKIRTSAAFSFGNDPFLPAVLVGDVNGDGRGDLLTGGKSRAELNVFLGVPGPGLFAVQPRQLTVEMPGDGERTWLEDINGDRKQDVLMHDAPIPGPQKLTILVAR